MRHEFNVLLLAPGVTIDQLNRVADPDRPRDSASIAALSGMIQATVGVLFAAPGQRAAATLVTDLLPGRTYTIRCVAHDVAGNLTRSACCKWICCRVATMRSSASSLRGRARRRT